jgi:hypothetical protein
MKGGEVTAGGGGGVQKSRYQKCWIRGGIRDMRNAHRYLSVTALAVSTIW